MKKGVIILFLIVLSISKTNAQNYFPKGATWYYDVPPSSFPYQYSFTMMENKGDSIFNNDTLKFLYGGVGCAPSNQLIKQLGQKIYKLNLCDSSFSLLYDFSANVGDTITIYPDICWNTDSLVLKIDSINSINVNGNILNQFYITQLYSLYWDFFGGSKGIIIEGIGSDLYLYPQYGLCDPFTGPLRCYTDTIIGEYNTGMHNGVCDTILLVGIDENTFNNTVSIFPNPTKNTIRINSDSKIEAITVYDIRGVKLLATKESIIDLSTLSKGIYFLKIHLKDGIVNRKILKE